MSYLLPTLLYVAVAGLLLAVIAPVFRDRAEKAPAASTDPAPRGFAAAG